MAPRTDAEAIAASLSEPRAFVAVFDRHFDAIHRYLRRRVGKATADDLASETFAEAFEHRQRYDLRREGARPWLDGIAQDLLVRSASSWRPATAHKYRWLRATTARRPWHSGPSDSDGLDPLRQRLGGPEVIKLELHHQDGYVLELPIVERFVLHGIPPRPLRGRQAPHLSGRTTPRRRRGCAGEGGPDGVRPEERGSGQTATSLRSSLRAMLAAGDRVPDATVWLSSREQARVTEIAGDGPILLFFYLFDWSAT
jgi:hypothetical protein